MGNAIQYDCERSEPCDYYESLHNIGQYEKGPDAGKRRSIYSNKFKDLCSRCTRPMLNRMDGKGVYGILNYPQAQGGFTIKKGEDNV